MNPRHLLPRFTSQPASCLAAIVLATTTLWCYWGPLTSLVGRWANEPDYSHGFHVPLFALVLLWYRRGMLAQGSDRGHLWGLAFLALGALIRWTSAYFYFDLLDPFSLLPCLAGIALLAGGWRALRWSWAPILFLVFMIPLPGVFSDLMRHPLQRVATIASTYVMQTIGLPAVAQGNVILLSEAKLGIAEACSGLRMLMLFFAVSVAVTLVIERRLWEKGVILACAVPIAVASNVIRITIAGILHETVSARAADVLFHDLAGWLMVPLAVGMLWVVLLVLTHAINRPLPITLEGHRSSTAGPSQTASVSGSKPGHGRLKRKRRRKPLAAASKVKN